MNVDKTVQKNDQRDFDRADVILSKLGHGDLMGLYFAINSDPQKTKMLILENINSIQNSWKER